MKQRDRIGMLHISNPHLGSERTYCGRIVRDVSFLDLDDVVDRDGLERRQCLLCLKAALEWAESLRTQLYLRREKETDRRDPTPPYKPPTGPQPVAPPGLIIMNGRWSPYGYLYVCARSKADASRMLSKVLGGSTASWLYEMRDYWNMGSWGNTMVGIEPRRGVWGTKKDHAPLEKFYEGDD